MTTQLQSVALKAQKDTQTVFTSLAHLLTPGFLQETWKKMNHRGAPGVDQETVACFKEQLTARVAELVEQVKTGRYKAPPVRRVMIEKGGGKLRPLGIPSVSDRLLQAAVARILSAIYEPVFLNCSWGYRPKRNAHGALRSLREVIVSGKVMQVFETDIRGYFDCVNHEWLRKMLRQKIADRVVLRLVDKWLRAGVMENGLKIKQEEGVPQGGPVSCILSNIYLHYVLDLWFEKRVKPSCKGTAHLVRYVDDFVACFQQEEDAEKFSYWLKERFSKFQLELSEEKTRKLLFGRFARERNGKKGKSTETFDFLGFRHICGKDRQGRFAVIRLPKTKSIRRFLDRTREWLRTNPHRDVWNKQIHLSRMLQGFYQYYGIMHSKKKLLMVYWQVRKYFRHFIGRLSQKSKASWEYLRTRKWFELPYPQMLHPDV